MPGATPTRDGETVTVRRSTAVAGADVVTMGIATREHLMDVAEELMAERGVDAVELNDIRIAAGQRNRSVVNYHFGDRAGLVRAIRQRHGERIDDERNRILDDLEANGAVTVRALVKAYVQPLGRCLHTSSGRNYVIILRDTTFRMGASAVLPSGAAHLSSMVRVRDHLNVLLPGGRAARQILFQQAALTGGVLVADIAVDINSGTVSPRQGTARLTGVVDFVARALEESGFAAACGPLPPTSPLTIFRAQDWLHLET